MTVYVNSYNGSQKVYHTDIDCRYLGDNPRERDAELVDEWGYSECELCADIASGGGCTGPRLSSQIRGLWVDGGEEA